MQCQIQDPEFPPRSSRSCFPCPFPCRAVSAHPKIQSVQSKVGTEDPLAALGTSRAPGMSPQRPWDVPWAAQGWLSFVPRPCKPPGGDREGDSSPEVSPAEPWAGLSTGSTHGQEQILLVPPPHGSAGPGDCPSGHSASKRDSKQGLCPSLGCARAGQWEEPAGFGLSLALLPAMLVNSGVFFEEAPPIFARPQEGGLKTSALQRRRRGKTGGSNKELGGEKKDQKG